MKTYIALLRGINVGGKGVLPMKELVAILESLGSQNVKTYIQSGNAVLQHGKMVASQLAIGIIAGVAKSRGFAPRVVVMEAMELATVVEANPFPEAETKPQTLHVFFLDSKPAKSALKSLSGLKSDSERFELRRSVLYLHAPDGIGRSKLAANVERKLGVPATSRNWRTVCKLLEIAGEYA